ncbi:uncharacterized protein LOC126424831 [Schistocerca serialis cubense]|uniref:uncharacterized protein LOC126424831 n=1 Tax=Schistocerca serialis cubense TaxID=2023355 RepID=UPI00214F322E|nr:uncharacterized protein LOC126424831 [Schistocerca serialis cubense]
MFTKIVKSLSSQAIGNYKKFRNIRTKIMKLGMKIKFNKTCLMEHIIPKYAKINIQSKSSNVTYVQQKSSILWIKSEIREAFKIKDFLNVEMYSLHLLLSNELSPLIFSILLSSIDEKIDFLRKAIAQRHQRKIDLLIAKQQNKLSEKVNYVHQFYPRTMNLTDIQFTKSEMSLLDKGLKYNLTPPLNNTNVKHIIADVIATSKISKINKPEACKIALKTKDLILKEKNKLHRKTEDKTLKNINNKLLAEKAIVVKADKGNTLVIIKEDDYIFKTLSFFNENGIVEVTKDPTPKFQLKIKKLVDENNHLLTPEEKNMMKNMNPQIPKLRSQIKLHKKEKSIRPIVNYRSSPSYKLNMKLNKILKAFYTYDSNFIQQSQSTPLISNPKYTKMTYMGNISDRITNLFKNSGITIAFTTDNTLQQKLRHTV